MRRVARHARSLAQLHKELASVEMKEKASSLGAGSGLGTATAVVGLYALGFGLATIAAALALVLDWWLSLLIVFAVLLVLTLILGLLSAKMVKKGTPLKPEQAIEEARLTRQAIRSGHGS